MYVETVDEDNFKDVDFSSDIKKKNNKLENNETRKFGRMQPGRKLSVLPVE